MTPEQRIEELEIRFAHLESTLQVISDEVASQQQQIERLGERNLRLQERVAALQVDAADGASTREEIPPHY